MSDSDSDASDVLSPEEGLSAATLAALQAHIREQDAGAGAAEPEVAPDFGKSQFWYDRRTGEALAREAMARAGAAGGPIAFVSAPTAFQYFKRLFPEREGVFCLEFDERFAAQHPGEFVFFDYNDLGGIPAALRGACAYVMCDPPYVNPETMRVYAQVIRTMRASEDAPAMLLTGTVLREAIAEELGFRPTEFQPTFEQKFATPMHTYTSFESSENVGSWMS